VTKNETKTWRATPQSTCDLADKFMYYTAISDSCNVNPQKSV